MPDDDVGDFIFYEYFGILFYFIVIAHWTMDYIPDLFIFMVFASLHRTRIILFKFYNFNIFT